MRIAVWLLCRCKQRPATKAVREKAAIVARISPFPSPKKVA